MLNRLGSQVQNPYLLMDRAYEGNETRQLALALGFTPVVPPLSTRVHPWEYDREMYKRREAVPAAEGVSSHSRFEKLDVIFLGSSHLLEHALVSCWSLGLKAIRAPFQSTSWLPGTKTTRERSPSRNSSDNDASNSATFLYCILRPSGYLSEPRVKPSTKSPLTTIASGRPKSGISIAMRAKSAIRLDNNSGFEINSPPVRWRSEMCRIVYIGAVSSSCASVV